MPSSRHEFIGTADMHKDVEEAYQNHQKNIKLAIDTLSGLVGSDLSKEEARDRLLVEGFKLLKDVWEHFDSQS